MKENNIKRLPLLDDYVFKRTFTREGTKELLKDLLESILNIKIDNVEVLNNEIPKDLIDEKASILDIRAEVDKSKIVDIELQIKNEHNMEDRSTIYMCKNISTQIKKGEDYNKLKPSIVINILNFEYCKRNSYHSIAHMKYEKTRPEEYIDMGYIKEDEIATKDLEMHFIELPKFIRKNPGVENKLEQWLWLIAGVKEDKIKMAENKNEKVKKAIELMDEISSDPAAWELYDAKMMARWNYQSGMAGAKEEGLEEGKKKNSIEVAEKMLRKGININTIIEITGLSLDELKENVENFNELVKISENK